jgi:hypothetical protein
MRQFSLNGIKHASLIMNLGHDLPNEVPVLVPYSRKHILLTFLSINLQHIDSLDMLLIDDFRQGAQLTGERDLSEEKAGETIRVLRREAAVEKVSFRIVGVGVGIAMEPREDCIPGIEREFRSATDSRQATLKDARIQSMKPSVRFEAFRRGWAGLKREHSYAFAFTMKKQG